MKSILIAATLSMALAGTAMARPHRAPAKPAAKATNYAPPRHWKQSRASYQAHVIACQRKYKSYNWRSDSYSLGKGRTAICRG